MNKNNKDSYNRLKEGREQLTVLRAVIDAQLEHLRKTDEVAAMEIDSAYTKLEGICKENLSILYSLEVANKKYTKEILELKK